MAGILNEFTGNEDGVSNLSISLDNLKFYDIADEQTQKSDLKEDLMNKGTGPGQWYAGQPEWQDIDMQIQNNPTTYYVNIIAQ